jgi:glutathione S-transferase
LAADFPDGVEEGNVSKPWVFMGVDRSHFSGKLRPALRYKQIHYVEYAPDMEEIMRRTGVGFVPVVITPENEVLQDTTDLIDVLEQRFAEPALLPPAPADLVLCRLFELYADEFFPTVSMRTRWAYPENEAELRRAFAAFSGAVERGDAVADLMSSYLPMLGVTPKTIPAIDAHTDDMLAALCRHFADHPYLLGERISLADCALMGPLYAHLYLDRVTRKKLYDDAIEVCMWIERCNRPVPEAMGGWFDGEYPDTLMGVLTLIGQDARPMLLALDRAFHAWAKQNATSGIELPRGVGEYVSELRAVHVSAGIRAYVPWKIQRLRDAFDAISAADQGGVREILAASGCEELLSKDEVLCRLEKREFKLVVA